jgi:hypothetical protein
MCLAKCEIIQLVLLGLVLLSYLAYSDIQPRWNPHISRQFQNGPLTSNLYLASLVASIIRAVSSELASNMALRSLAQGGVFELPG